MTNYEINSLLQKEINFQGCFMRDEQLPKHGNFILNLDNSNGVGTHWVAVDLDRGYYYDAYGLCPPDDLKRIKFKKYNTIQHQRSKSNLCGLYAIYFIHNLNRGLKFYNIVYDLLKFNTFNKSNHEQLRNLLSEMQT